MINKIRNPGKLLLKSLYMPGFAEPMSVTSTSLKEVTIFFTASLYCLKCGVVMCGL